MNYIIGVTKMAELLGVSRKTLYRYMESGMPYKSISEKKRAFDVEKVNVWISGR